MTVYRFVRYLDIFSTQVSVSYMNGRFYKTFCGGSLTIITILLVLFFGITELVTWIDNYTFRESTVIEDLGFDNSVQYNVSQDQAMIAFQFVNTGQDDAISQISDYLQFYFVKSTKTVGQSVITNEVVSAIPCLNKYTSENSAAKMIEQFHKNGDN